MKVIPSFSCNRVAILNTMKKLVWSLIEKLGIVDPPEDQRWGLHLEEPKNFQKLAIGICIYLETMLCFMR